MLKKLNLVSIMLISGTLFTQISISNPAGGGYDMPFFLSEIIDNSNEFKKIKSKMYLSEVFNKSQIDSISDVFYLRYNMFKDEMEFMKNEKIYYLQKLQNRKVHFIENNSTYKILQFSNKLGYFKQLTFTGKNTLFLKNSVKYIEAKPAATSYQTDKPADFKREDDVFYLKFVDNTLLEIPTKKKDFFSFFNNKETEIKEFVNKNKLEIDKEADLIKVINYLNTL